MQIGNDCFEKFLGIPIGVFEGFEDAIILCRCLIPQVNIKYSNIIWGMLNCCLDVGVVLLSFFLSFPSARIGGRSAGFWKYRVFEFIHICAYRINLMAPSFTSVILGIIHLWDHRDYSNDPFRSCIICASPELHSVLNSHFSFSLTSCHPKAIKFSLYPYLLIS